MLLAAQVGIAGSTVIEDGVTLAGQVGVAGHLTIGKGVIATAQTGIPNSVDAGAFISGYPAIANRDWLKSSAVFRKLPELRKLVADLERRIAELEAKPARGLTSGRAIIEMLMTIDPSHASCRCRRRRGVPLSSIGARPRARRSGRRSSITR